MKSRLLLARIQAPDRRAAAPWPTADTLDQAAAELRRARSRFALSGGTAPARVVVESADSSYCVRLAIRDRAGRLLLQSRPLLQRDATNLARRFVRFAQRIGLRVAE